MALPQSPQKELETTNDSNKFIDFFKNRFSKLNVIVGILIPFLIPLYNFLNSVVASQMLEESREKISQVSTYASYGKILETYHGATGEKIAIILRPNSKYQQEFFRSKKPRKFCKELIRKYGSGIEIYYSKDFKEYRDVHNFFETLGLLVENNAVDFALVFDSIAFPGSFPDGQYPLDLRKNPLIAFDECVAKNWFGKGQGLLDYGASIKKLGYNYNYARIKTITQIKTGKEKAKAERMLKSIEKSQCQNFYPSDPVSTKVSWNKLYVTGPRTIRFIRSKLQKC